MRRIGSLVFGLTIGWSSNAVSVGSSSLLRYREVEVSGTNNINCRNGTVRFWYRPNWSSTNAGGLGPGIFSTLIQLGAYSDTALPGMWLLSFDTSGTTLRFTSQSDGVHVDYIEAPCSFVSNRWHQIALTYSPSNIVLYTNGQVAGIPDSAFSRPRLAGHDITYNNTGHGIYNYPPASVRVWGFWLGNDFYQGASAKGQFEELETFNYALTAQEIGRDFPGFNGAAADVMLDTDYDGRSDVLEREVDGTATNNAGSVVQGRLGYWRFNPSTNWIGEQGQVPLFTNNLSIAASWSSSAAVMPGGWYYTNCSTVIGGGTSARLIYRDVEANGWANFNCRNGAVRLWFKPNWSSGCSLGAVVSLVDMGVSGLWQLGVISSGSIFFKTSSNGTQYTYFTVPCTFVSNRWQQLVFNYSSTNLALYNNGLLLTNLNVGVSNYPNATDRTNGLSFGNGINGQFEELETFNYQLTTNEIRRSFETIHSMDSDLNGIPDILEDIALTNCAPFLGVPFVITGCIEAEQFDKGGKGIAYTNVSANTWTNDYRASAMQITNCSDKGLGYCVDQLRADEWLKYTIDVRAAGTYAIEPRAAGIGTGGVFKVEFSTNGVAYTNTGPLTILTTNWTNITYRMLDLVQGTNVMRLLMLTNGSDGQFVGKFNYTSVYPAWNEGVTNIVRTNDVSNPAFGIWTNGTDWASASNNAVTLQNALNDLKTLNAGQGGRVVIPPGTFYVSQLKPDETKSAISNSVARIPTNNVEIVGAGKTNTILIAHNRATTMFHLGGEFSNSVEVLARRSNFTLRDIGFEARPHLVATDLGGTYGTDETTNWLSGPSGLSSLIICYGPGGTSLHTNVVIESCLFRNAAVPVYVDQLSRCLIRGNEFIFTDGTNGPGIPPIRVGIFATWGAGVIGAGNQWFVITDNIYNGNPNLTSLDTNYTYYIAADGLLWAQQGGNFFVARNYITNYATEGVQLESGPIAVVQNDFFTFCNQSFVCAGLPHGDTNAPGPTSQAGDFSYAFIGNDIVGGRLGVFTAGATDTITNRLLYQLSFCGNTVSNHLALNLEADYPGAAVRAYFVRNLMVAANTLTGSGHGVVFYEYCTNAVILKNDFNAATHRAIAWDGASGFLQNATIAKNVLGQGESYHLKLRYPDSFNYFLMRNTYKNGTSTNAPFLDASGSPVHFYH